ncbi:hypothetical protein ABI59_18020 [Acidobacteria bacterium Mor1]|nr:hypothetical protein ABI59_18020 [Acidobacteria bacterium Mor1]
MRALRKNGIAAHPEPLTRTALKRTLFRWVAILALGLAGLPAHASYVNFEASQVHPITRAGNRLLVVNTPSASLDVFDVLPDGSLGALQTIPVGLEPVSVTLRSSDEAWVVNHLSDSISIVDLSQATVIRTLATGDEPTDVAFAAGKAFVAISQEDRIEVWNLADLDAQPASIPLFSEDVRALAVSGDGSKVYAVSLLSGNQTTVVNGNVAFFNSANQDPVRLAELGLPPVVCDGPPPPYPPLPAGIERNPALTEPADGIPKVSLIVRWNPARSAWEDETGSDWSHCLPYRLPDHDLFIIDAATLAVNSIPTLGTSLFEVSVHPQNGRIYVPHTEARNFVRFEHPLGVEGHVVDNRIAVVDPSQGNAVTQIDLNGHIDRESTAPDNLAERRASISQPGMMVWESDGSHAWLTGIGSRKLFRLDGSCLSPACIFGPDRAAPQSVEVGGGPSGVALFEDRSRAYVLDRFDNRVVIVDTAALATVGAVALTDPSSIDVRDGRRFLYDAVDLSGHGDAACSSCHISGDLDGLAWDLGNPEGDLQLYGTPGDNVRFVAPRPAGPEECIGDCVERDGFDPQKGPMTTQTFRAMVEPLHWRGDRGTFAAFNPAFVGLLGSADIDPGAGTAGLSEADMELFRRFVLGIAFPPNPYRTLEDGLPDSTVQVPDHPVVGNPTIGETLFTSLPIVGASPCTGCHALPFGTAGGKLGGIQPGDPTTAWAGLLDGTLDNSLHQDLKVAHLRNMYEKPGPPLGSDGATPAARSGFGFSHNGSFPDLASFLSINVFNLNAQQVRDISTFLFHFPTGTRPAVGKQLTLPAGAAPTGSAEEEALLQTLIALGDLSDADRHCDLTASLRFGGGPAIFRLEGGGWIPDRAADSVLSTALLRAQADGPLTFTCGTVGSGARLGGDRDEDDFLNRDDCAPSDGSTWRLPAAVDALRLSGIDPLQLNWQHDTLGAGPSLTYEVLSAPLSALSAGPGEAPVIENGLASLGASIPSPTPARGEGAFYLVRGRNVCGAGPVGAP